MHNAKKVSLGRYVSWAFLYFHLVIYIGISALLIVACNIETPGKPWYIIPMSTWGLFVFGHFILHFFTQTDAARRWREGQKQKLEPSALKLGLDEQEIKKQATVIFFFWMAFYLHLSAFAGSSAILILINYLVSPEKYWSLVAVTAWGIWVIVHYVLTYLGFSEKLNDWRTEKIKSFIYNEELPQKEAVREGTLFFGFWLVYRIHLILYLLSNTFLFLSDMLFNSTAKHWFYYPLIGWGVIFSAHWLVTFLIISPKLAQWRKNRIRSVD